MKLPYSADVLALNPELATLAPAKRSKFGNVLTPVDAGIADSGAEARRWNVLRLLEQGGIIRGLTFHPVYELPGGVKYEADSAYEEWNESEWVLITEDVKGAVTSTFRIKQKLFEEKYGRMLRIIPAKEYR